VNGAGKSTLLKVVTGVIAPTEGRVKQGKTVKFAILDQQLADLHEVAHERVNDVIGRQRTSYVTAGKEMTPGQLLERLGFTSAQLQTPIKDLSGGQKRRLQFLLILLNEPNVLILDEPTNDLDTDMLAAMEDLLDGWPGTLLVVSHDRYLLERVTDQQYAVLDGRFRHLPGGVDQYLQLRKQATDSQGGATDRPTAVQGASASVAASAQASGLSGAEKRNAEKELGSIDRKLAKAAGERETMLAQFASFDQSDFDGLAALQAKLTALDHKTAELEVRWLELSELLA
jgi:ATP-binding cassette subfamily F protein uup